MYYIENILLLSEKTEQKFLKLLVIQIRFGEIDRPYRYIYFV
jgi:hypothetical protein